MPKKNKNKPQKRRANVQPRPKPKSKPSKKKGVRGSGPYSFGVSGNWPALGLKGFVTGKGPYEYIGRTASQAPRMQYDGDGWVLSNDEYLGDLLSSTSFANNVFPINVGNSGTFPWLSKIAKRFEEYKLEACIFSFRSTSADALNSVNTALGTVIMAAEYNVLNSNFTNKIQMENTMWACSMKPSESSSFPVECDSKVNPLGTLYVQNGQQPSSADLRMYQLGSLQIATVGMQSAGVNIGEIWVSYKVRLTKPYLASTGVVTDGYTHMSGFGAPMLTLFQGYTSRYNSLNLSFTDLAGSSTVIFPPNSPGNYYITYMIAGGTASIALPNVAATFANCSAFSVLYPSGGQITNGNPDAGKNFFYNLLVTVPQSPLTSTVILTNSAGNFPTGVSNWNLIVSPLPSDFN